jgi:hypothetical protein
MRFLPTEVRNRIETSVKRDPRANNWYTVYEAFVKACHNCPVNDPVERSNNLVTARRQKHNGMS